MANNITQNICIDDSNYEYRNYVDEKDDGSLGIFIGLESKSGIFYTILGFLEVLYYFIPLLWIIKYRNWYVFKQRNFILTFIGGIANFICTFSNSSTNIMRMSCSYSYYSATVATFIMQICYIFRAFRLILLYKLNIFKVTILSEEKFTKKNVKLQEPNIYFKSMYKLVNNRLIKVSIPLLVLFVSIISGGFHLKANLDHKEFGTICGTSLVDINARINSEMYGKCYMDKLAKNATLVEGIDKKNVSTFSLMHNMFLIPEVLCVLFIIVCLVIASIFTFTEITDNQKFGFKFDCFSSAIISIIVGTFYFYFKFKMKDIISLHKDGKDNGFTTIHQLYLRSKRGILFFVIIGLYIQLTSIIIPLIQCIKIERLNKKNVNDSMHSLEFFKKVLKQQSLVEELKSIAIQEFSVENILFWENYCILHKMVDRVVNRFNDVDIADKDIEYYPLFSLEDLMYTPSQSESVSSVVEDGSYNPNLPILPQLQPYFDTFYYTFIHEEGQSKVNLRASTVEKIDHELDNFPTVGVFDKAKNEIVEAMYFSIYPIFLQQNRNRLGRINSESDNYLI